MSRVDWLCLAIAALGWYSALVEYRFRRRIEVEYVKLRQGLFDYLDKIGAKRV